MGYRYGGFGTHIGKYQPVRIRPISATRAETVGSAFLTLKGCYSKLSICRLQHEGQQAFQQSCRRRRAARNVKINRKDCGYTTYAGIAVGENAAVERAGACGNHPFRGGHRLIGPLQRFAHIPGYRSGSQEDVSMARRGDELQPEPFEIVEGVAERMQLKLARIAGPGVDMPDRQAPAQSRSRRLLDPAGKLN